MKKIITNTAWILIVVACSFGSLAFIFFPNEAIGTIFFVDSKDVDNLNMLESEFEWACECQAYRYAQSSTYNYYPHHRDESADKLYSTDEREMWEIVAEKNEILKKHNIPKFLFRWVCNKVPSGEDF